MKKLKYWVVLVILIYGIIELFSYVEMGLLEKYRHVVYTPIDRMSTKHTKIINKFVEQKTDYFSFDPTLGWTIKENGGSGKYQTNSSGIRSNRDYASMPPHDIVRVLTFGDSFTHCDNVRNNETWQAIMESYDPKIEVLNFGVGGYGLDQAYLRYLEMGRKYKSHFVFIGFMSENIFRDINTYRPFYYSDTGMPLTKPRFVIKDGKLSLVPNQIQELQDYKKLLCYPKGMLSKIGSNDYYYQRAFKSNIFDWSPSVRLVRILVHGKKNRFNSDPVIINGQYNENSEAFEVTKKIFDEFYNESIKNKSTPIILVFPNKLDLIGYRKQKKKRYAPLLAYFDLKGYDYIDIIDAFKDVDVEDLFGDHYSPLGNKLVAMHLLNCLSNRKS